MRTIFIFIITSMILNAPLYAQDTNGELTYKEGYKKLKKYGKSGDRLDLMSSMNLFKEAAEKNNSNASYTLYLLYSLRDVDNIDIDRDDIEWYEDGNWDNIPHTE